MKNFKTFRSWLLGLFLWCGLPGLAWAQTPPPQNPETPVLEVFVRQGCPHCAEAKAYLPLFARERPWLRVVYRSVDDDATARDALVRVTEQAGYWPPGVPTFVFQGRVLVGFADAEQSGPELAALVDGAARGPLSTPASTPPPTQVDAGRWGTLTVTTGLAGVHAGARSARRLQPLRDVGAVVSAVAAGAPAGSAAHGADCRHLRAHQRRVYYAFMAAWLNVFLAVGFSAPVRMGLALLALASASSTSRTSSAWAWPLPGDSCLGPSGPGGPHGQTARRAGVAGHGAGRRRRWRSWSTSSSCCARPDLPAVYTAVLTQQGLSPAAYYAYLGCTSWATSPTTA
jgi:glutaredoxin